MTEAPQHSGLAVLCAPDGGVRRVVRDEIGASGSFSAGHRFIDALDDGSRQKAEAFLSAIGKDGAAFDWLLCVPVAGGRPFPLHMAGITVSNGFLIVGANTVSAAAGVLRALLPLYKMDALAMGELLRWASERVQWDDALYDDLSRLNNELITAQRELARRNAELAHLNDEKNKFLGIAAHDLRNPLSVILGYSEYLCDVMGADLDPRKRRFINDIRRSSEFMLGLVDDLLDVSKIEAGRLVLNRELTDFDDLIQQNIALNRVLADRMGVRLIYEAKAKLPEISLDRAKIDQVLNNLIANAIKISPPESTIRIELALEPKGALIRVVDQGPGIPHDELEAIFRPFHQGGLGTMASGKGAGLGLAIANSIVRRHGGRIWAESIPPDGASFLFVLPITTAAERQEPGTATPDHAAS